MKNSYNFLMTAGILILINSCEPNAEPGTIEHISKVTQQVSTSRLITSDASPENWITFGKNYNEDRFSPLDQISKSSIDSLGLAWSVNLGAKRGIEATPLVVDGMMYISGPWSIVYAIDARTWQHLNCINL